MNTQGIKAKVMNRISTLNYMALAEKISQAIKDQASVKEKEKILVEYEKANNLSSEHKEKLWEFMSTDAEWKKLLGY